ncbi:phosphatidate cytidylyltransferase [Candidatus Saccharibacteria bacterium]|nr:phosphatidate cytidylyltransferase [Candidatus Saccharibacteria bacterium]
MSKSFQTRLLASLALLAIAAATIFTLDSMPFKIFYGVFAIVAGIELLSFFKNKVSFWHILLVLIELALLVFGSIFIARITALQIILIIFGVCGYDVFAYIFGGLLGGKIFKKSRPFRFVSKNKTWEGTFLGLASSFLLVGAILLACNSYDYIFLASGIFALMGDLLESFIKRQFKIKDSGEILVTNKIFDKLEILVGGKGGHGGYLDRIDSMAFANTVMFVLFLLIF